MGIFLLERIPFCWSTLIYYAFLFSITHIHFHLFIKILQALWVEYRTEDAIRIYKVSINDCILVRDLIEKIQNTLEFGAPKDFPITLHEPFGTMISVDSCPSPLILGNSQDTPIHVRLSVPLPIVMEQTVNSTLTSFWNSLRELSAEGDFLHFSIIPEFFPEGMKTLCIREAYKDLFKIISNHVYSRTLGERLRRILIAGH
jgi:hypothetical protein